MAKKCHSSSDPYHFVLSSGSEPTSEESEPFGKSILLAWKHIRAWFLL